MGKFLSKITRWQCFWIKWLYDNSSRLWKIITFYLIGNYLKKIKFHQNLANKIKQTFKRWSETLSSFPNLSSAIASKVIWYKSATK